ncbi:MAG: hypothetical protein IPL35_16505 [Sphingobacteriales bacterium]|nr:hypothetical protein [Sphingobacteriales bacterium]
MEIEKLSIADLKAAWDFVREDLKDLENVAMKKNVSPYQIPAYNEEK